MRGTIDHFRLTPRVTRFALIVVLLILGLAVSYQSHGALVSPLQGTDGRVSHTVNGNIETWRIDEPNVKQHITPYPQVRFQPGDHVTIQAGGCVQTGGWGSTWKRYVNPSGPNADRLYHGLIWIPGVIGGRSATGVSPDPKRIVAYLGANQSFVVPSGVDTAQLYLRLGYEDDGYGDNSYDKHDDGTQDQCKGVGNAYVSITIIHGPPHSEPTPSPAPFDLVWDNEDDNGIPLNAKWGWQITHRGAFPDPNQCANGPFKSPCTNWSDVVTQDTAEICNLEQWEPFHDNPPPLYGVAGHVNWAAGTYVGRITWESKSSAVKDDDYNFDLFPVDGAGLTSVRDNLEVEFDSDETIDHFNTPWWRAFHNAVDNYRSNDEINQLWFKEPDGTIGRYAIVTGLIGLEMCHSGSNELHPAWAIAIRVKDDDPADEVWAMFIRRSGNEGFCSGAQHYLTDLPNDTYTFRLPWRPGAATVNVASGTTFLAASSGTSGPAVQSAPNQGVLVSFTLPAPHINALGICDNCNRINGELHLQWLGGQGPAQLPGTVATRRLRGGSPVRAIQAEDPEERIGSVLDTMTPIQRSQYLALFPRQAVSYDAREMGPSTVSQVRSLPRRTARARHPQYRSVPDSAKQQRNKLTFDAVGKILGKTVR